MVKLVVFLSSGKEVEFVLQGNTSIGRLPGNTLIVPEDCVSKKHCEVLLEGDSWRIKDLDSTNGTSVQGSRVPPEGLILKNGDEISIGGIRTIFHFSPSPAERPAKTSPSGRFPGTPPSLDGRPHSAPTSKRKSLVLPEGLSQTSFVKVAADHLSSKIQGVLKVETGPFLPENKITDVVNLRQDYEKLRITYELMAAVGQEIDLDRLLDKILEYSFAMLSADRGAILIYDRNGFLLPRAYRLRNTEGEKDVVISSSMVKMIENDKVAILSFDASKDPRFNLAQSVISQGIRSSMAVPLLNNGQLLGILFLDSLVSSNAFSEKDLRVLSNIANQAALMVAHASLIKKHAEAAVARSRLQRMFSPSVAELISSGKSEICPGGEPRRVTVMFSDIRGFTTISEGLEAPEIVSMVNEYFESMVDIIFKYDGTLDKFVGDEIMALFGAPIDRPDDAFRAIKAALEMLEALKELNKKRNVKGNPSLQIGIGINTGDVVAGYIGSSKALQYTVIGSPVNLANRLCSRARDPVSIVISENTLRHVKDKFEIRELESVPLKGITQPVKTFQVIGELRHKS